MTGLVDAGVLVDDSPQYLAAVTFVAPQWGDKDALTFIVEPV